MSAIISKHSASAVPPAEDQASITVTPSVVDAAKSQAKATEGKAGMAVGTADVRRSTTGTGLRVGESGAVLTTTSEFMDVTAGETATNSNPDRGYMGLGLHPALGTSVLACGEALGGERKQPSMASRLTPPSSQACLSVAHPGKCAAVSTLNQPCAVETAAANSELSPCGCERATATATPGSASLAVAALLDLDAHIDMNMMTLRIAATSSTPERSASS